MTIDELIDAFEGALGRHRGDTVVMLDRIDVEEMLVQVKSLSRSLRLSESSPGVPPGVTAAVRRWSDVPAFADEQAEAAFWQAHGLDGEALASLGRD